MKQKDKFKVDQEMAKWYFEQGKSQAIAEEIEFLKDCRNALTNEWVNIHIKERLIKLQKQEKKQ